GVRLGDLPDRAVPGDLGGRGADHHLGAQVGGSTGLPGGGARADRAHRDMTATVAEPSPPQEEAGDDGQGFTVRLDNFEGPFDLLLQLIGQHRLDVTEIALHTVTDDFVAFTRRLGAETDLEQITGFLVVAATLLDLKAARLLPAGEVDDEDDLELLDARDLLFARVLQYRAYKQVAGLFAELEAAALRRYPAAVGL